MHKKGLSLSNSKILLLGAAYKKDISDYRESPVQDIILLLEENGAQFAYHDPFISEFHNELNDKMYESVDLNTVSEFDAVVVITDHTCFNYQKIASEAQMILDTRNAFKNIKSERIIKL